MICPHCNTSSLQDARFCPACGLHFSPASPAQGQSFGPHSWMPLTAIPSASQFPPGVYPGQRQFDPVTGRVAQNLQPLGVIWCIWGLYHLVLGLCASVALRAIASHTGWWSPDEFMPGFLQGLVPLITITTALMAGLSACAGYGLLARKPWARTLGVIMGILALIKLPLGTALGAYTLWILAPRISGLEYEAIAARQPAASPMGVPGPS